MTGLVFLLKTFCCRVKEVLLQVTMVETRTKWTKTSFEHPPLYKSLPPTSKTLHPQLPEVEPVIVVRTIAK